MRWLRPAEWGAGIMLSVALLLVVVVVAGLFIRRRALSSAGGVFDCASRLSGPGWSTGFARYHRDEFQWFRTFSIAIGPRLVLSRVATTLVEARDATASELEELSDLQRIVVVQVASRGGAHRQLELAMTSASATGLLSWLEAAPPGRPVSI